VRLLSITVAVFLPALTAHAAESDQHVQPPLRVVEVCNHNAHSESCIDRLESKQIGVTQSETTVLTVKKTN
jgi:hypothetical protein